MLTISWLVRSLRGQQFRAWGREPLIYLDLCDGNASFPIFRYGSFPTLCPSVLFIRLWKAQGGAEEMSREGRRWLCGKPTFLALANQPSDKVTVPEISSPSPALPAYRALVSVPASASSSGARKLYIKKWNYIFLDSLLLTIAKVGTFVLDLGSYHQNL